jgi:hypothetical protein
MFRALFLTFLLFFSTSAFAAKPEVKAALTATHAWLALVDGGRYSESWEAMGTPAKAAVTVEQWQTSMNGVRKPLGDMKTRKLKKSVYSTTLPGAPDGQYVTLQFKTAYSNKKGAVETATSMLDADGAWHVVGYFIK